MIVKDLTADVSEHRNVYRLLYCSKVSPASTARSVGHDIEDILIKSRHSNPIFGVTGVLLTNKKMYSQVLEGPASAVMNIFGHISCDLRHRDVRIISHHASKARFFQEWSMAYIHANGNFEAESSLFPVNDEQFDIIAISVFCAAVRRHLLDQGEI